MRIIHIILAGWLLMTVSNNGSGKDWRGIVPLKPRAQTLNAYSAVRLVLWLLIISRIVQSLSGTHIVNAEINAKTTFGMSHRTP